MACGAGRESDNTLFVSAWNRITREIEEITRMTNSEMHTTLVDNGKEIVGRQVIGRGKHPFELSAKATCCYSAKFVFARPVHEL